MNVGKRQVIPNKRSDDNVLQCTPEETEESFSDDEIELNPEAEFEQFDQKVTEPEDEIGPAAIR